MAQDRDLHPRSPPPLLRWHRQKSPPAPKKDRQLSFICLIASKSNAGRTEVCLTPSANYSTLITRHPYMRTLRERSTDNTCEGTGGASVWVHGERVVAVPQHATRRCGGRAGVVCGGERSRPNGVPASHVDDEACVSFCCFGRENQRTSAIGTLVATITTLRQFHLPRAVLGLFSGHGHHGHHGHT